MFKLIQWFEILHRLVVVREGIFLCVIEQLLLLIIEADDVDGHGGTLCVGFWVCDLEGG